jgi:L-threonylcarbamoyladenylate synthase
MRIVDKQKSTAVMHIDMENEINKAVEILRKGKVILYPTDTIWGIGCDATQSKAVERVYKIKIRPGEKKQAIILLDSIDKIEKYVKEVPEVTRDLIEQSPTPLTIIFEGGKNVAKNVLSSDGTIAIRIVKGDFCVEVIKRLGKPIVSTSANVSGEEAPIVFSDVSQEIVSKVDYVVNVHRERIKSVKASTIIKLETNNSFTIIRP